jgi:hypothetical protein
VDSFVISLQSKNRWISTLCSAAIHLLLLLILAISSIAVVGRGERSILSGMSDGTEATVTLIPNETSDAELQESQQGLGPSDISTSLTQNEIVLPELDMSVGIAAPPTAKLSDVVQTSGQGIRVGTDGFVPSSLDSRKPQNRSVQGAKNGASAESEAAVERCLKFLARNQENNGSWSMGLPRCPECTDAGLGLDDHRTAATGLALLCFLGAGHSMNEGEYSEVVRKGVYFLVQTLQYEEDPNNSYEKQAYWLTSQASAQMYEHGIATLAITEALQMSEERALKEACQAAVNFICSAQYKRDGGWDYHPRKPGDLSIVGWQIMALKSASAAKLKVPVEVLRDTDRFVNGQAAANGYLFKYRAGGSPTPSMTAIGNLIRLFRGQSVTDPLMRKANEWIANQAPSNADVYYNYYATQFMFHSGGPRWRNWNLAMREMLVYSQVLEGPMAGSWYFDRIPFNVVGGRLYTTTMSCLTLEVYYRFMPVYETSTDDFRM